jgi:hypothetical protein
MKHACFLRPVAIASLSLAASAQSSGFQTPGMPSSATLPAPAQSSGQADRFSAGFNPAFSFIVDALADNVDYSGGSSNDGAELRMRTLEFAGQAWVDPTAWAYFVGASEDEELSIEEAAVHYKGLGGNHTIRAGRFFIDFGKQMQTHVHELRTVERPLVLRAYLGDEVNGDGVEWDSWTAVGEATTLRWSLGVFNNLLPDESEFPNPDSLGEPLTFSEADRKHADKLNFTARVTGFTDVGEHGVMQLGASWRGIPQFSAEDTSDGLIAEDLSNNVLGLDFTYGLSNDTAERRWTFGSEVLFNIGDNGVETIDPDLVPASGDESLRALNGTDIGYFAYADYAWDRFHSVGVQFSQAQMADSASSTVSEVDVYYTRKLSEYQRLRFQVSAFDGESQPDSVGFAIQYTAFVGAHGHGLNW